MGADLVGFFVKGPYKFTKRAEERAVKAAQEQIDLAKPLVKWLKKYGPVSGAMSPDDKKKLKLSKLSFAMRDRFEMGFVEDLEVVAKLNARKSVKKFKEFWSDPYYRDVTYRPDPDDATQMLLFAGDMSCGDEPDGGGYTELKEAFMLRIPEALGIR